MKSQVWGWGGRKAPSSHSVCWNSWHFAGQRLQPHSRLKDDVFSFSCPIVSFRSVMLPYDSIWDVQLTVPNWTLTVLEGQYAILWCYWAQRCHSIYGTKESPGERTTSVFANDTLKNTLPCHLPQTQSGFSCHFISVSYFRILFIFSCIASEW